MSGVGFGTLLAVVFLREAINATVLNPWKIYESTKESMKEPTKEVKPSAPLAKVSEPDLKTESSS
jgi:hypothetical protein